MCNDPAEASGPTCEFTRTSTCGGLGAPRFTPEFGASCACDPGYQRAPDQCALTCTSHAKATNPGSSACACLSGWSGRHCECFQGAGDAGDAPCISCSKDSTGPPYVRLILSRADTCHLCTRPHPRVTFCRVDVRSNRIMYTWCNHRAGAGRRRLRYRNNDKHDPHDHDPHDHDHGHNANDATAAACRSRGRLCRVQDRVLRPPQRR